jgi:hypothetical protein
MGKYTRINVWQIIALVFTVLIFLWNALGGGGYYSYLSEREWNGFFIFLAGASVFAGFALLVTAISLRIEYLDEGKMNADYKLTTKGKNKLRKAYAESYRVSNILTSVGNVLSIPMFIFVLYTWFLYFTNRCIYNGKVSIKINGVCYPPECVLNNGRVMKQVKGQWYYC